MGRPGDGNGPLPPPAGAMGADGAPFVPDLPVPPAVAVTVAAAGTDAAAAEFLTLTTELAGRPIYAVQPALFQGKLVLALLPGALDAVPAEAIVAAANGVADLELIGVAGVPPGE
jgi:hypothetical protein